MAKKVGYTFVYGVDGFGADVAPAYEEGFYLDFNKAWAHFIQLTAQNLKEHNGVFNGYCWPDDPNAMEADHFTEKTAAKTAERLWELYEDPPIGWHLLVEVEVK